MEYIKQCVECQTEFTSQRADSKCCSPACRKAFSRNNDVTDNVTLSPDVTLKDKNVTLNDPYAKITEKDRKDFTRALVEANLKAGDTFIPNWYTHGHNSRDEAKVALGF